MRPIAWKVFTATWGRRDVPSRAPTSAATVRLKARTRIWSCGWHRAFLDEVADAGFDDAGLAAAGGGDDERRVLKGQDGVELFAREGGVLGEGSEARLLLCDEGGVGGVDHGAAAGRDVRERGEAWAQVWWHPLRVESREQRACLECDAEPLLERAVRDVAAVQGARDGLAGRAELICQLIEQSVKAGLAVLGELACDRCGVPWPRQADGSVLGSICADELDAAEQAALEGNRVALSP